MLKSRGLSTCVMIAAALAGAGCSEHDGTDSGTGGAAGSHAGSAGAAGFGGAGAAGGAGVGATGGAGAAGGAGATGGAAGTGIVVPAGELPTHSKSLPFSYVRPEAGNPIPDSEISRITDLYLGLLDELDYFNFVDLRAHGWPESAPGNRYWYATWWSGIDVSTSGGGLRYYHRPGGADNNGLRTAGLLEGACYAHLSWKKPKAEHLARRLMRGFASWVMGMERTSAASDGLMTRAAYPEAVDDGERNIEIDYSDNRPGTDNGATEYVHVPDNPHWGEIWIKNKRSKDDLGHILRALAQIDACDDTFQELDGDADLREVRAHYQRWAQRVEDDGFKIATYDKSGAHWIPPDLLANFILANGIECTSALAIRLTGRFAPTAELVCGNGIGPLDQTLADLNDQNGEIFRTFHEAAANHALLAGENDLALALLEGLAIRVETSVAGFEAGTPPKNMAPEGLAELILHAANAGVPLTWREVGWLHDRIEEASASYSFDSGTFTPSGKGIEFRAIGALLGLCVSQYRNPATKPVFDCAKIAAQPSGI